MLRDSGPPDRSEIRGDFVEFLHQTRINEWIGLRPEYKRQATIDWIKKRYGYEYSNRLQIPTTSGPLSSPTSADRAKLRESSFVSRPDIDRHNRSMINLDLLQYTVQADQQLELIVTVRRRRSLLVRVEVV